MSPWAVHFTTGYDRVMSILWDGFIKPFDEPHGAGRLIPEVAENHRSSALSEIPLHLLKRLVTARSHYGIGFAQEFLVEHGGGRVWYLEVGGAPAEAVQRQVDERAARTVNPDDPFWASTPFIDFPDPFHPFTDWRWEREWRVPCGLGFTPENVAFLFIPEHNHTAARQFFTDHKAANTGPAYLCPYIDPTWDRTRIQAALEATPPEVRPAPHAFHDPFDDFLDDLNH
jgi:hypothetical protein